MIEAKTGNEAAAEALRQINPDVVAAYPITPQTEIVQIFAQYVSNGIVKTEYIPVESEHSALSLCIGAAAGGVRAITATSSQGLALLWEMLYIASGLRLPLVMINVNRALSSPINIHCDHSDSMGARDSGWIQIYSENVQEVYDNVIMAPRIAESCRLPVMVMMDGFIISHGLERIELLPDEVVKEFIGEYKPTYSLLDNEITMGAIDFTDYFFEHKRQQIEAMNVAENKIEEVILAFNSISGRNYTLIEEYNTKEAKLIVVCLGSTSGTVRTTIKRLKNRGKEVGLIKLRLFRPFPALLLSESINNSKCTLIVVLDRSDTLSTLGGPLFIEVKASLYQKSTLTLLNYIYGLGGRDLGTSQIENLLEELYEGRLPPSPINYLGVR